MWKKFILDILFPQFCLNCKREGNIVCYDCLSTIEILEYRFCPFCNTPTILSNKEKCPQHQTKALDGLFAATSFKVPLVQAMIEKFKNKPFLRSLKDPLSYLIIAHFLLTENTNIFSPNSIFVPVPLTSTEKRKRGYNQAEEISKILSSFFKRPNINILSKKAGFKVNKKEDIKDKIIFLIDDVFLTGTTMEECAEALKGAGAKEVWGIVVARDFLD